MTVPSRVGLRGSGLRIERTTRSLMALARGAGPVFERWLELDSNVEPPTTSGSKETPA